MVVFEARTHARRAVRRVCTAALTLLLAGCSAAGSSGSTSQKEGGDARWFGKRLGF